jgi:hypothetical protein
VNAARRLDGGDSVMRKATQPQTDDCVAIVERRLVRGCLELTTGREEQFVGLQNILSVWCWPSRLMQS